LGYSLLSNDENEKALKVFKECVAMSNSDPTYLFMCAKILLNLNQPKECLEYLEMINEIIEENSFWIGNYHHLSGLAYGELSQRDTSIESKRKIQQIAIDHLLKANEKNKDDAKVLLHIALQYAENREIKNAFKYVKLSLDLNSNVESWILLTLLFSSMKDYQKSITCVKTALSEYPSDLQLLLLNARLEEVINESRSFKLYQNIFEILKKKQELLFEKSTSVSYEGIDVGENNNLRQTVLQQKKTINLVIPDSKLKMELCSELLFVADGFRRLKSNKIAIEVIERAKKLLNNKLNSDILFLEGRILEDESKNVDKIIQSYENVLIKDSNHVGALERIGALLAKKEEFILSKSYFQSTVLIDPTLYEIWFQLGNVFKKLGDLEESSNCLITAVKLHKTSPIISFDFVKRSL
jgi:tetratricopeptide (TPR) repeat protein